jgi:hypothetical protein
VRDLDSAGKVRHERGGTLDRVRETLAGMGERWRRTTRSRIDAGRDREARARLKDPGLGGQATPRERF